MEVDNKKFKLYGSFCSLNVLLVLLADESIDDSTKFETLFDKYYMN
jgi:hypothetical protein